MAKIARKAQKIFASGAANNGQFGSAQAGTKILSTDLDILQALTAFTNGWNDATISSQRLPTLEEFQALNYINTYQLSYLFQEGIPEYNVGTTYYTNSLVKKAGTYELWGSVVNDNVGNALVEGANWHKVIDLSATTSTTAYGAAAGGTTAYTVTTSPTFAALATGQILALTMNATNTGAVTVNPNSIGAVNVKDALGNALTANALFINRTYFLVYDGTNYRVIGAAPAAGYGVTTGGTTTYAITTNPQISALYVGQVIYATFNAANTGASTLNVNGLGATPLKDAIGGALVTGSLAANKTYACVYDGTNLRVLDSAVYNSYGTTAGGTTTYTITTNPSFGAVFVGQVIYATFNAANTGASTINPNSLGAINLKDSIGGALSTGSIQANRTYQLIYDGTNFRVVDDQPDAAYGLTTNSTNAYSVTTNPPFGAITIGLVLAITFNAANTGAATLNVNGTGAVNIRDALGNALASGQIVANKTYTVIYDGTQWRILTLIGQNMPTGSLVQRRYATYATNAALTTALPIDDTIPTLTEGAEWISDTITSATNTNKIRCTVGGFFSGATNEWGITINDNVNTIQAFSQNGQTTADCAVFTVVVEVTGTAAAQRFASRIGNTGGASCRLNGTTTTRLFGGVAASYMLLEEFVA